MSKIQYGNPPKDCGQIEVENDQHMIYLYLPISIEGSDVKIPRRLKPFKALVNAAFYEAGKHYSWSDMHKLNVYLTVKCQWVTESAPGNRPGLHADGYGSNGDINFIWADLNPTEFAVQDFVNIPDDDFESMAEMERQLDPSKIVTYPDKTLLMLDESVVHRVGPAKSGMRTFVKISFSKHKYNLKGNSINYDLDYDWKYYDRSDVRNVDNKDYVI